MEVMYSHCNWGDMLLSELASGEMGPITEYVLEGIKLRTGMASSIRTNSPDEPNPEPVPFQPQNFMSSTKLKTFHISKRHHDTFGGAEYSMPSKRGIILHSDRYNWEGAKPLEGTISQRDRMRLEIDYVEKLRGLKKRKEVPLHRAELDLLMAGKKIEFDERFDLNRELQHLKSLVLPDAAKDLFHGKGIRLPDSHASVKPRPSGRLGLTFDVYDDEVSASAPAALRTLSPRLAMDPDIRRGRSPYHGHNPSPSGISGNFSGLTGPLPSIGGKKSPNLQIGIGPKSQTTVSLNEARRHTKGLRALMSLDFI